MNFERETSARVTLWFMVLCGSVTACEQAPPSIHLRSFSKRLTDRVRIHTELGDQVIPRYRAAGLPFAGGLPRPGASTPVRSAPTPFVRPEPHPAFTPESEIHELVGRLARAGQMTRTMVGFIPVDKRPWKTIMYWILNQPPNGDVTLTVACGRWARRRWYGAVQYRLTDRQYGEYWREYRRSYTPAAKSAIPWLTDEARRERARELGRDPSIWPSACRWIPNSLSLADSVNGGVKARVQRPVRPAGTFAKRGPLDAPITDALRFSWAPNAVTEQKTLERMRLNLSWAFESYGNNPIVPVFAQGVCKQQLHFSPKGEPPVECVNFSAQHGYEWSTLRFIDPDDYPAPSSDGG